MQALFRNPLADPALVGVSSGGAFAAACAIVISDSAWGASFRFLQLELLPIAAFAGSLLTTTILYKIASREGRTSVEPHTGHSTSFFLRCVSYAFEFENHASNSCSPTHARE